MKAIVAAALLLAGCYKETCDPGCCVDPAQNEDTRLDSHVKSTLALDASLTQEEQSAAMAAADAWAKATDGQVSISLSVVDDVPDSFTVRRAPSGVLKPKMVASTKDSVISLDADLSTSEFLRPALVHEFGHYLGLGDEPDLPDDIMYPCTHEDMPGKPTPDALHDLRVLYGFH
jgi:hypothetical protein